MKNYSLFIFFIAYTLRLAGQSDTTQHIVPGRVNAAEQQGKSYVILVSADGFRHDYVEKFQAGNLRRLGILGVRAKSMIPSFPALTFPNHYSIVTGLYPSHHGIADNNFYDPRRKDFYSVNDRAAVKDGSWYGGTPLWVLAEQQQMLTASFYWVGSEAAIRGVRPSYYYIYSDDIPLEKRLQVVVDWLQLPPEKRPHLISFYFPEADHAGHVFGPDAQETRQAVQQIDSAIGKLVQMVSATGLPVNFIFVADHGMTNVDTAHTLQMPAVDTTLFVVSRGAQLIHLYHRDSADFKSIASTYASLKSQERDFTVYLAKDMPARYHYSPADDAYGRSGQILLLPKWPRVFKFSSGHTNPGAHGFDPALPDMHAVFYCWGPAFRQHLVIPSFENVNVFPVITRILGLSYHFPIDGTDKVAREILR